MLCLRGIVLGFAIGCVGKYAELEGVVESWEIGDDN